jgi:hypothetical protein
MATLTERLEWRRDQKGYRLVAPKPPRRPGPHATLLARDVGQPAKIVRLGGRLVPWFVPDDLYRVFAKSVTSPAALLDFIKSYAPLTHDGLDPTIGENVDDGLRQAKMMRDMITLVADHTGEFSRRIEVAGWKLPPVHASLRMDPEARRLRVFLAPRNLIEALWLQLAQVEATGSHLRICAHCGIAFEAGKNTTRRADARFCSDAHRVAFNSLQRSRKDQ